MVDQIQQEQEEQKEKQIRVVGDSGNGVEEE